MLVVPTRPTKKIWTDLETQVLLAHEAEQHALHLNPSSNPGQGLKPRQKQRKAQCSESAPMAIPLPQMLLY